MINFPYNVRSDWLKQCASSENRARVDDSKLAFKFLLRNFDKLYLTKLNIPCDSDKTETMERSTMSTVNMAHEDHYWQQECENCTKMACASLAACASKRK